MKRSLETIRAWAKEDMPGTVLEQCVYDMADEIERLQGEVEELRRVMMNTSEDLYRKAVAPSGNGTTEN